MSMQLQSKVLIVVLQKIEPLTVIKNEPPESEIVEIGIDDILDSSDEESIADIKDREIILREPSEDLIKSVTVSEYILENNNLESVETQIDIDDILDSSDEESIPDVKDIEIVLHKLSEDLIKSENVSENILVNNHTESMETQIFVKSENNPFIETENITQSENLNETENTSDVNVNIVTGQELIKVQDSNEHFNAFGNQTGKQLVLNFSKNLSDLRSRKTKQSGNTDFSECDLKKDKKKRKVIEIPMIPVESHESTTSAKAEHACNKNKSTHKQNKKRYCCKKCTFISENYSYFKQHKLSHKTEAEVDGRYLKYRCDRCEFKTCWSSSFKRHKIIHLKPEQIPYCYCYYCPYKCKQKGSLKTHIFNHFENEEVSFHCYICDFTTLKRNLIIEHFKKHPKHHSKCDEADYKNQLETYTKKQIRCCCEKCTLISENYSYFKQHKTLTHKTEAEVDGRYLKYRCDKCKYKTCRSGHFKRHKLIHLKPEQFPYFYCYHCPYKCKQRNSLKTHIFNHFKNEEVSFYCYICDFTTLKRNLIIEHFKKHPKHHSKCDETDYKNQLETYTKKQMRKQEYNKRFCCEKCTYRSGTSADIKRHRLTHKTKEEIDDRLFKYRCDKCEYKTYWYNCLKAHKLTHLKPEEIHYFYCYHCSFKSKHKGAFKNHVLRHFKYENVPFHCYICDFRTLKRNLIIEHLKKHPEHHSKCDETEYKNQLETYTKKQMS